jgi:tripartite-type tricarboxylate transporter receptor subunit TctC
MHLSSSSAPVAIAAVVAAVFSFGAIDSAAAQSLADFYKGKQVNVIIGYGVGGGYDQYTRVLSRYMGDHIPGKPTLVVQNMPGAGSRKAANWLYNVAPKDGSVLASLGQNTPTDQVLGRPGIKFDASKFNWIGNMVVVNNTLAVWHTTGVKTIEDATKKELAIGATGASSPSVLYPQVSNNLLGTKFKIISGYPGGGDINLAMERGEVDGRGSNSWASWKSTKSEWLRDKKVNILFQVGLDREEDLPNVPLLSELGKTEEDRRVLEVISADVAIGRPILTTPDVPKDRVAALRKAFDDTLKDPAFKAETKKQKMDINPMSGEKLQQVVAKVLAHPPGIIAKVKEAITIKDVTKLQGAKKGK